MMQTARRFGGPVPFTNEPILRKLRRIARYTVGVLNPTPSMKLHLQKRRNRLNKDAIFIWIPKTAGTSIVSTLEQNGALMLLDVPSVRAYFENRGLATFGHMSLVELVEQGYVSVPYFARAWKFAFVRNPYSRAVSLYHYLVHTRYLPPTTSFAIFCSYLEEHAYEPVGLYNHEWLSQLNPQASWLFSSDGQAMYDFLGRFENLDEDFSRVREMLQLRNSSESLPSLNTSNRQSVASHYTQREKRIVAATYAADFACFGYDLDQLP
jgi:Sulfotransferase family